MNNDSFGNPKAKHFDDRHWQIAQWNLISFLTFIEVATQSNVILLDSLNYRLKSFVSCKFQKNDVNSYCFLNI